MCGVIVVDAGRSRSTNLGRDAYVMIIGYCHNYLKFYQFPNNNLFTHRLLFFSREATSEIYGPGVSYLLYLPLWSILFAFIFISIKPKIPCCTLFYLRSIYSIYYNFTRPLPISGAVTRKGLTTPLTRRVARCCYLCAGAGYIVLAWFAYWFDTLVS